MTKLSELLAKQKPQAMDADALGVLGEAVNKLLEMQENIRIQTNKLNELRRMEEEVSGKEIPDIMAAIGPGIKKLTLNDGREVSIKEAPQSGIPASVRQDAYAWLEEHGHGGLIKAKLTANFPRDSLEEQRQAAEALEALGISAAIAESVHAGTLKAWARTELEAGRNPPDDLFRIHIVRQTTVK